VPVPVVAVGRLAGLGSASFRFGEPAVGSHSRSRKPPRRRCRPLRAFRNRRETGWSQFSTGPRRQSFDKRSAYPPGLPQDDVQVHRHVNYRNPPVTCSATTASCGTYCTEAQLRWGHPGGVVQLTSAALGGTTVGPPPAPAPEIWSAEWLGRNTEKGTGRGTGEVGYPAGGSFEGSGRSRIMASELASLCARRRRGLDCRVGMLAHLARNGGGQRLAHALGLGHAGRGALAVDGRGRERGGLQPRRRDGSGRGHVRRGPGASVLGHAMEFDRPLPAGSGSYRCDRGRWQGARGASWPGTVQGTAAAGPEVSTR
jgi:hypothetical protein